MSRLAILSVLLLGVAGCDAEAALEAPEAPPGFFVARVVDASGNPVANVEVDLLLAEELNSMTAPPRVSVSLPYPHPIRAAASVPVFVDGEAADVRIFIGDGDQNQALSIFEGTLATGEHLLPLDASTLAPGLHYLWTLAGTSESGSLIFVTAGEPGELPVVLPLGTTDADGFVAVAQARQFPSVVLSSRIVNVVDGEGEYLGLGEYGDVQRIRLRTPSGATRIEEVTLETSRTVVAFRLD